jgi:hypothetical protein
MLGWGCNFNSTEELMSLTAHLEELKKKHQALSDRVEEAQRAPGIDDLSVSDLKKQKLRLKEEITRLSS